MIEFETSYHKLPNGVRHLQINAPGRDITAVAAHVKTGSRNDSLDSRAYVSGSYRIPGISHTTEHFLFKGTDRMTEREMALKVDRMGANHSANTDKEHTLYYMETAYENAPQAIGILGEVLARPTFPSKSIRTENGVLVSEIAGYKDDETSTVQEIFERLMFGNSDMSKPILGTERSIKASKRQEILKYHREWYRGGNVLVVTAGKVRGLRQHVEHHFGKLASGPIKEYKGSAHYGEPGLRVQTAATDQAHFVLGFPGVPMGDPRYASVQVLGAILGGHSFTDMAISIQSSRLYDALRVRRGALYEASASIYSGSEVGYLSVDGNVRPHLFKDVLEIVKDEVFSVASTVTRDELDRAKEFWRFYFRKKVEGTLDLALLMGLPALILNIVEQPSEMLSKIESVTLRDVRRTADELMQPEEMRLAVLGPFDENLKRTKPYA